MLFNSIAFLIFLPITFFLYWFFPNNNKKTQNWILIIASYYFYGSWDYRFLFLLIFSTFLDFFTGLKVYESKNNPKKKKFWLLLSIIINLGFLGFFKYYNFFIESFEQLLLSFGLQVNAWTLNVILPVGISFYTFHGMSYLFDIYNEKIEPNRNFVEYSVFVCFFPLLVAGPIERATHLLPQLTKKRIFNYSQAVDGLRQILWGFFKKIVIADNCALIVNSIFNNYENYTGSTLFMGTILFAFQIYGDFSGYTDIALGTARLFGIELLRNFSYPYFSRDIAEFWRRWHISLSSWFKDYLYKPLGGNKGNILFRIRNIFIIFLVSGFWHGANWTFIVWGALNAIYYIPLLLLKKNRDNIDIVAQGSFLPSVKDVFNMLTTFMLVCLAWIFFRSDTVSDAFNYISIILSPSLFSIPEINATGTLVLIVFFIIVEWINREKPHSLNSLMPNSPRLLRWSVYSFIILVIFFAKGEAQEFIYFQF